MDSWNGDATDTFPCLFHRKTFCCLNLTILVVLELNILRSGWNLSRVSSFLFPVVAAALLLQIPCLFCSWSFQRLWLQLLLHGCLWSFFSNVLPSLLPCKKMRVLACLHADALRGGQVSPALSRSSRLTQDWKSELWGHKEPPYLCFRGRCRAAQSQQPGGWRQTHRALQRSCWCWNTAGVEQLLPLRGSEQPSDSRLSWQVPESLLVASTAESCLS